MVHPVLNQPGLVRGRRVLAKLHELVGDVRIEDLPIPYVAVAADVIGRREVWFRSGSLLTAIRSSIAIPVLFTPVWHEGRLLMDGGVMNPLPVTGVMGLEYDLVVGVSMLGRPAGAVIDEVPASGEVELAWTGRISKAIQAIPVARKKLAEREDAYAALPAFEPLPGHLDLTTAGLLALDVMQAGLSDARCGVNPPDVLVEVPADASTALDFDQAERLIDLGAELASTVFDAAGL
jgi:NTE family protein